MEDLAASYRRHNEETQTAAILRHLESLAENRVEVPDFPGAQMMSVSGLARRFTEPVSATRP